MSYAQLFSGGKCADLVAARELISMEVCGMLGDSRGQCGMLGDSRG